MPRSPFTAGGPIRFGGKVGLPTPFKFHPAPLAASDYVFVETAETSVYRAPVFKGSLPLQIDVCLPEGNLACISVLLHFSMQELAC